MEIEEVISAMSLFIEKADKLRNSNFVKRAVKDSGVDFSASIGEPTTIKRRGPDDENIEAFVLTFRFFVQDNEKISLRKIKDVFESSFVEEKEKNNYNEARNNLNTYLDGATMFNVNGVIQRRTLMEVFIYGGLSHANESKKKKYDHWMGNQLLAPFMQNEFIVILFEVLNVITFIRNQCETVLKRVNA